MVFGTVNNFYASDIEIEGVVFDLCYPSLKIMTNDGSRLTSSLQLGQYMRFGHLSHSGGPRGG